MQFKKKVRITAIALTVLMLIGSVTAFGAEITEDMERSAYSGATTGDEEAEYITSTKKNDTNNAQITYHVTVPEGFTLGAFVDIENAESGLTYHILATAANEHYGRMFVPDGEYHIVNCGIADDITNKYPLTKPEDFTVDKSGSYTIETTLEEYDRIEAEADRRLGKAEAQTEPVAEEESVLTAEERQTASENSVTSTYQEIFPWRRVGHVGNGTGKIIYSGVSEAMTDVIIEITRSGEIGKSEFRYSTDNGETWSDISITQHTELTATNSGEKTGISVKFEGKGEDAFIEGDSYTFFTDYEYKVMDKINGQGVLRVSSTKPVMEKDYKLIVKITETGGNGVGKFKYTLDGKNYSEPYVIPVEGLFEIPDTVLQLTFHDKGGPFVINDTFTSEIKGIRPPKDFSTLLIIIGGIVMAAGVAVFLFFFMKKEKPYEYTLNAYKKVELPGTVGKK